MKVFVSGASGLVGGNCMEYFSQQGVEVIGSYFSYSTSNTVYFDTLNPSNPQNFDLKGFKPDVVVHCGALTHVDYCEEEPDESYQKTVRSTLNLIDLCKEIGAKLVYISTDYVFDGHSGPYLETDAVHPLSVYAQHKLDAEKAVLDQMENNALILRVTNVYGTEVRNKNFVARIMDQCKAGQKLTLKLPYDQYATPVNAKDIARSMLLLLQHNHSGVFNLASTDWMNRVELALTVLKYFPEANYELIPMSTVELAQPALRPLRGGLLTNKFSAIFPKFLFTNVDDFVRENSKI